MADTVLLYYSQSVNPTISEYINAVLMTNTFALGYYRE
jgi:hypothetical protein